MKCIPSTFKFSFLHEFWLLCKWIPRTCAVRPVSTWWRTAHAPMALAVTFAARLREVDSTWFVCTQNLHLNKKTRRLDDARFSQQKISNLFIAFSKTFSFWSFVYLFAISEKSKLKVGGRLWGHFVHPKKKKLNKIQRQIMQYATAGLLAATGRRTSIGTPQVTSFSIGNPVWTIKEDHWNAGEGQHMENYKKVVKGGVICIYYTYEYRTTMYN